MIIANIITLCVLILGSFNWFLVGVFSWNLLAWIFGTGVFVRILYALVGLCGLWLLIQLCVRRRRLFSEDETMRKVEIQKLHTLLESALKTKYILEAAKLYGLGEVEINALRDHLEGKYINTILFLI